ncbi:MAG TPA: DUF2784 domain-containing protein [Gemmatimonadales bacterium]
MGYRALADLTVLVHLGFIGFVLFGVLLVARRRRLLPLHVTCAAWGAYSEFTGTICPLTPLENRFRQLAGEAGYQGGFIEHYIWPLIYPAGLTPSIQVGLGVVVVVVNAAGYALLWRRWRRARLQSNSTPSGRHAP